MARSYFTFVVVMAWAAAAKAAPVGVPGGWSRGEKIGASVGGITIALMLLGLLLQLVKLIRGRRVGQQDQDGPVDPQNLNATGLRVLVVNQNNVGPISTSGHAALAQAPLSMPGSTFVVPRADLGFTQEQLEEFIAFTAFREFASGLSANALTGNVPQRQAATRAIMGT